MTAAIVTQGLTKDYGGGRGIFDLDIEVNDGEVLGYLGPNGAGKTTTIRLLMGMIHPTRGRAEVYGLDAQQKSVEVKRLVGYVPGELPNFGGLRGSEIVAYMAGLRGGVDNQYVTALCRRLDLNLGLKFREYSRGNKQKLAILLGFMHRPKLLILDEPTGGLDPLNQQEFYAMCHEVADAGATVFLSSHILSEVEHISDRVGIIRSGRLIKTAKLAELHELHLHEVDLEFAGDPPVAAIEAVPGVDQVKATDHRVHLTIQGSFAPLMRAVAASEVVNYTSHEPSLEELFLTYYRDGDGHLSATEASPEAKK
jgi:ABC-type multidrug transport system ATPase subunit